MATRLYFSTASAPVTTLPFGSPWSVSTGAVRRALLPTKTSSAHEDLTGTETTTNAFTNRLVAQYVSEPLQTPQTITGTLTAVIRSQATSGALASLQMAVLVYSSTGTLRGTLYAGHGAETNAVPDTLGHELPVNPETRIIPNVSLNPVSAEVGDRICVAVGSRNRNATATAMTTTLRMGAPNLTDFIATSGQTDDFVPWVEFSQDLVFGEPIPPAEVIDLPSGIPFEDETVELVRQSHRQTYSIQAYHPTHGVIKTDVEQCQISWDEARAPRVMAKVTIKIPDATTLDRLDPREGVRLEIYAGYDFGSSSDSHMIANLLLTDRNVKRPDNVVELDASSDEILVIESVAFSRYDPLQNTITNAIKGLLEEALPHANTFYNGTKTAVPGDLVRVEKGGDWWSLIMDLTNRIDAELFDDGLRRWYLRPRPSVAGEPSANLRVGEGGVIITSSTGLSRSGEWANSVLVKYTWTDTNDVEQVRWGSSSATGPYAFNIIGRKAYTEERKDIAITTAEANKVAKGILARRLAYGRTFSIRAISHYWLRPGMTVNVKLPTGDEEKHLVKSVMFDLTSGWMDVDTRLPDYVNTPGD